MYTACEYVVWFPEAERLAHLPVTCMLLCSSQCTPVHGLWSRIPPIKLQHPVLCVSGSASNGAVLHLLHRICRLSGSAHSSKGAGSVQVGVLASDVVCGWWLLTEELQGAWSGARLEEFQPTNFVRAVLGVRMQAAVSVVPVQHVWTPVLWLYLSLEGVRVLSGFSNACHQLLCVSGLLGALLAVSGISSQHVALRVMGVLPGPLAATSGHSVGAVHQSTPCIPFGRGFEQEAPVCALRVCISVSVSA